MSRGIEAVIFDWAGTTVDYGCFAPVQAFAEVFKHFGVEPTMDEVREPMGMLKIDHIRTMLSMPRIHGLWVKEHGTRPGEDDVKQMYDLFESKLMDILDQFTKIKPYVLETVNMLREKGIKIGSTTGYTDAMMEVVAKGAKEQGYEPDAWFSPDSAGGIGRPYPYMIFKNLEALKVSSVKNVVKIGDTVSDIKEARHAGVISVGVVEGSSEMGMTEEEYAELTDSQKEMACRKVKETFKNAGAHYVIKNMSELSELLKKLTQ
ncbi:phosphonoacetaldehyde hydrolase [Anaerostipes sp.]|uniref:phosphonoacetaldehyde hydrolase n=1 Tax=Anaerostipes sp. TaxID=1872530 RepID=UPI0025C2ADD4|nr:phosphonoacetaldehyde hydrolase [Anaerostipes sp.]MBS7009610.1 phosphonoacetaldehyde hydrolase [Anaerostipes sp.]